MTGANRRLGLERLKAKATLSYDSRWGHFVTSVIHGDYTGVEAELSPDEERMRFRAVSSNPLRPNSLYEEFVYNEDPSSPPRKWGDLNSARDYAIKRLEIVALTSKNFPTSFLHSREGFFGEPKREQLTYTEESLKKPTLTTA